MRVLLIEDDELLGDGVKTGLTKYGYTVDWLKDGKSAERAIVAETFDVIVLDLGLPSLDGIQVLRSARDHGVKTPVLILTARDSVEDRIRGLDSGADDYLTKPFNLQELAARIRAMVRRSTGRREGTIHYKNIVIDPAAHTVSLDDELVPLSRREFALLQKLLEHPGQVLSRDQLTQSIYGWQEEVDSNALEVHIHNLRKRLNATFIRTIRGVGYMVDVENPES